MEMQQIKIALYVLLSLILITSCEKKEGPIHIDDKAIGYENQTTDWLAYGRTHNERRFFPEDNINIDNVANFLLINLWGDVPLKSSVKDHEELFAERTPKVEVWAAIEADLKMAIDKLPVSYDSESDYGRATKGAAIALLGKSYLYQEKYSEAIAELSKLGSGPFNYGLASSLDDLFVNDIRTNETVFAVMHAE